MVEDQIRLAKLWVWRNVGMWSGLGSSISPVGNHQPWELDGWDPWPQERGWLDPHPQGSGWWIHGHTHVQAASQQIPNALANQICGAAQRSQHPEHWESHTGSPGRLYWLNWLFFAEQRPYLGPARLIPWSRSMSHLKSYFYSFPPAPRLQAGFCTLISLCPSAAGAVASRHQD